ncbi:MAG: FAD:protein FMN transferase [Clostridia bacterium]|nr:FAD:protein FMN transferase [Clostridia bacterium]
MKKRILRVASALALIVVLLLWQAPWRKTPFTVSSVGMGTVISLTLYGAGEEEANELFALFDRLEKTTSFHLENSALSALNTTGETREEALLDEARVCLEVFEASGGALDPTVGVLTALWRIGLDDARVPDESEITAALALVDASRMRLTDTELTVGEGQKADFGAVGKGYACDLAQAYLADTSCRGAVVSVGGSLLFWGSGASQTWTAAIRHPFDPKAYAGTLSLTGGFVSTSGDYERVLKTDEGAFAHILDPKTGHPAQSGLSSVTVIARTGALSDALSTACFVLGKDKARELLTRFDAQGVLIAQDGAVTLVGAPAFTLTAEDLLL